MKITYINHSSFSVELENNILLFDYFKGDLPEFDDNKHIYVFSSHHHHDHYSSKIFDLQEKYKSVTYILSSDIRCENKDNRYIVKENEEIQINDMKVKTFLSTDIGVAFLVKIEDKVIYHAGDLNWWHWEGENTDEENKQTKDNYQKEIAKLKNEKIDISFVVLDYRQGDYFYLGFDEYMRNINTDYVFPMHCWDKYDMIDKIKHLECSREYRNKIIDINHKNQIFNI